MLKRMKESHPYTAGSIYGRLVLTGKTYMAPMYGQLRRLVEADCECGSIRMYLFNSLVREETQSCGCLAREMSSLRMTNHGLYKHPLFTIWVSMRQRCYNKRHKSYPDYGGRGISVCDTWNLEFLPFYKWAIENGWAKGLDIDRQENNGNYDPDNCKFVSRPESNRNTRRNRMYTAFGETKCLFDWGKDSRCVVSVWALRSRIDRDGWDDFEKALTSPAEERKDVSRKMKSAKMLTAFGETKCQSAWLEDERCLVKKDSLVDRLNKGWDAEKAISTPPSRTNIFNKNRLLIQPGNKVEL